MRDRLMNCGAATCSFTPRSFETALCRPRQSARFGVRGWSVVCGLVLMAAAATKGFCADSFDPLLEVMIKNGLITEEQAEKVKAHAEAMRTNNDVMSPIESK